MNTLVDDLKTLIHKHLSSIEDLFINGQTYEQIKTIKRAIKNLNWKWILYFLYRYQRSIIREAYMVSFWVENNELMKIFDSMFMDKEHRDTRCYYNKLKYLAKIGQYDKLDQLKLLPVYQNFRIFSCKINILKGLIVRNDLETIKSNRYGDLIVENIANTRSVIHKIFKHGRLEILEYIQNKIVIPYSCMLTARIESGHVITKADIDALNITFGHDHIVKSLADSKYYDYAEYLIEKDQYVAVTYIESLVSNKQLDVLEIFKSKTNICKQDIIEAIIRASFIHDNLELFIKYIRDCNSDTFQLSNNSFKILTYIINTKMSIKLEIEYISDPKIIKMLYTFVEGGGVIARGDYTIGLPPSIEELHLDAARKLLSEYEQDNCF